ncbi:hypothetical protein C0993_000757 [Termitomyces sp. T159_Od127]|nr:hypothetical protein C0993_000757 [Termitomyces sp. T159_Od127]
MDQETLKLARILVEKLAKYALDVTQTGLGISGVPASGKSTFSELLTTHVNNLLTSAGYSSSSALLIGMDGWHLSRAQLDEFPDPKLAHDRRGSHWTFDALGYVSFIRSLRGPLTPHTLVLTAPSFDHALKDPTYDDIIIRPYHRIVVIEGLYTLLSIPPWNEAGHLLDERWHLDVGIDECRQRLIKRHVATGVAKDIEEAIWRAEENDIPNGRFVIANMLKPTRSIRSIEDPFLLAP